MGEEKKEKMGAKQAPRAEEACREARREAEEKEKKKKKKKEAEKEEEKERKRKKREEESRGRKEKEKGKRRSSSEAREGGAGTATGSTAARSTQEPAQQRAEEAACFQVSTQERAWEAWSGSKGEVLRRGRWRGAGEGAGLSDGGWPETGLWGSSATGTAPSPRAEEASGRGRRCSPPRRKERGEREKERGRERRGGEREEHRQRRRSPATKTGDDAHNRRTLRRRR